MRNWQGRLQDEQRISSLAWLPCVERKFLYRAFDGTEWAPLPPDWASPSLRGRRSLA